MSGERSLPRIEARLPPLEAAAGDAQPTLLGQYGDWGAYTASPGGNKVCFALAKPKTMKTEPEGRKRDPSYVFVSTRPADKVKTGSFTAMFDTMAALSPGSRRQS